VLCSQTVNEAEARRGPDPACAVDLPEFIQLLARFRAGAGSPPLRVLARRVGPLMRPPRTVSHSTLAEVFQLRRRRLDLDLVLAVVRALGADEATVDEWRTAYLRIQRDVKTGGAAGTFRQLPADLATFTGREDAVDALLQAAAWSEAGAPRAVVISAIEGMAGVGKTRLAVHVCHALVRAGRFADVQLYVDLRGFDPDRPPADPSAVLDGLLRQLGEAPGHIPETLEERAAMFRDRMHGREAILLLDNAADEEQVRDLIPGDPHCLVLITSRRSLVGLDGAHTQVLNLFTLEEGLGLLKTIVGAERVAAEPKGAAELVEAVGRLPLAVSLLAARLRSRPTWSFAELNRKLADDLSTVTVRGRSLVATLDLSYRGLPDDTRYVFRMLGLHPGVDFTLHAVAALADLSVDEAGAAVDRLVDEHLAQEPASGRYVLHDVVRRFAADRAAAEVEAPERDRAITRLLRWFVATTHTAAAAIGQARPTESPVPAPVGTHLEFAESGAAMEWYEAERHTLLAAVHQAKSARVPDLAWRIVANMFQFFHTRLYLDDWLEMLRTVESDADDASEPRAAALMANQFACVHLAAHRFDQAFVWSESAAQRFEALDDRRGLVGVLNNQAMILQNQEKFDDALESFDRALAASLQIDVPDFRVVILNNIASLEMDRDRPHDALPWLNRAQEAARGLDLAFTEGKILTNLTTVCRELGRDDEAMEHAARALEILRDTGNELDEARVYEDIGVVSDRRGDRASALTHWRRAHAILADHDDPRALDVAARLSEG
jgi:tetratricopeptide (TPR) repeat protein